MMLVCGKSIQGIGHLVPEERLLATLPQISTVPLMFLNGEATLGNTGPLVVPVVAAIRRRRIVGVLISFSSHPFVN